ncbi:MAG TPA: hypothetical protein VMH00_00920 [Candidatus Limnocylindrales bacterium]|nr:hypothetical protein [Candidatus Limnocylindrales bacterium]
MAKSMASRTGNLEETDGSSFHIDCACGESATLLGLHALKHWVETWPARWTREDRRWEMQQG